MRFLRLLSALLMLSSCLAPAQAKGSAAPAPKSPSAAAAVLPASFSGWERTAAVSAAVNPTDAKILKEFGLVGTESATYQRGDRKMTVKALRFPDATGAYGVYKETIAAAKGKCKP